VWKPETRLIDDPSAVMFGRAMLRSLWRDQLDVVHSHGFTSAALAGFPSRMLGIPHVATIHDVVTEALEARLGRTGRMGLALALQQATVVHAVGKDAAANLTDKLLSERYSRCRLRTIRNGVDLAQFSNVCPRALRSAFNLADDVFILGFLGRFMAPKGFRTLIDAACLLRDERTPRTFRILAVGDGGFVREDRAEVTRRGLDSTFIFQSPVEDVAPTLAALDCLVMPSRWEAFGLLAAEALCLGVPLIASDCIGLREVVANTPARIFQAGNASDLAKAIRTEMADPSGSRARAFVGEAQRRFDVRDTARKVDQLFDEVLERSGRYKPGYAGSGQGASK